MVPRYLNGSADPRTSHFLTIEAHEKLEQIARGLETSISVEMAALGSQTSADHWPSPALPEIFFVFPVDGVQNMHAHLRRLSGSGSLHLRGAAPAGKVYRVREAAELRDRSRRWQQEAGRVGTLEMLDVIHEDWAADQKLPASGET